MAVEEPKLSAYRHEGVETETKRGDRRCCTEKGTGLGFLTENILEEREGQEFYD